MREPWALVPAQLIYPLVVGFTLAALDRRGIVEL